jgi:hypothetical protein
MNRAGPELSIRRFTVSEFHRMRATGILPAQARVELLRVSCHEWYLVVHARLGNERVRQGGLRLPGCRRAR